MVEFRNAQCFIISVRQPDSQSGPPERTGAGPSLTYGHNPRGLSNCPDNSALRRGSCRPNERGLLDGGNVSCTTAEGGAINALGL